MNFWSNFVYGIYALAYSISLSLKQLIQFQLLWGFILGLAVATLIYAIVLTKHPKEICTDLTRARDVRPEIWCLTGLTCFDPSVLAHFTTTQQKITFILSTTLLAFLGIILVSLLFF